MRRLLPLALLLTACPPVNSKPCNVDADCGADGRCRRGACGPICVDDSECGTDQICSSGKCVPRPECAADADCAQGFVCKAGVCSCTGDSACASNQQCVDGQCQTRAACTKDEDCTGTGRRCEVTQGVCIPPCTVPADCAPGLDPNLATALYQCFEGTCMRRCTTDPTCGASGLICKAGLCAAAECKTMTDCPSGQYCTDPNFGRCMVYKTCASDAECDANYQCKKFATGSCPPGFPCSQQICMELPRCLIDSDCNGQLPNQQPGYCGDAHCQPTSKCTASSQCPTGQICITALCMPSACRGLTDCPSGKGCVDGACVSEPLPTDINVLAITPERAFIEVGETTRFTALAFRLDGSSFPLSSAKFDILDGQGNPSTAATADSAGNVTGVSAATVTVHLTVPGAFVAGKDATLTIYPAPASTGRRVVVIEASSGSPVTGATVRGCDDAPADGGCPAPVDVVTDSAGIADFSAFSGQSATFHVVDPTLRADNLPAHDRVSVLATSATDLLVPLPDNPVHGQGGFNASVSFANVHSTGQYWVGYSALSFGDPADLDLRTLLGDTFQVDVPGVNQKIPVPGSVVLYTSPGFGIPQQIKGKSLGLGQGGTRSAVSFAGRSDTTAVQNLRSTDLLAYTGAMDYAIFRTVDVQSRPWVPDVNDVDNDGLCSNQQKCPQGSEDVPDYANFAPLSMQPNREQNVRTEVDVPNVPQAFDTVIVSAVQVSSTSGMFPLGLSSRAAGAPDQFATRPVAPVALRSGSPYGGTEIGQPGIWALAASLQNATSFAGGSVTSRLVRYPILPQKVQLLPFLPIAEKSSYSAATRVFAPGQPNWNALAGAGAKVARVIILGSQQRHLFYFPISGSQTAVRVPEGPSSLGVDPAGEAMTALSVEVLAGDDLAAPDDPFTLKGPNLWNQPLWLTGYSRFQP